MGLGRAPAEPGVDAGEVQLPSSGTSGATCTAVLDQMVQCVAIVIHYIIQCFEESLAGGPEQAVVSTNLNTSAEDARALLGRALGLVTVAPSVSTLKTSNSRAHRTLSRMLYAGKDGETLRLHLR